MVEPISTQKTPGQGRAVYNGQKSHFPFARAGRKSPEPLPDNCR